MGSYIEIIVLVSIVSSTQVDTSTLGKIKFDCQTYECPSELPLCTPVGCVSTCPKDSYRSSKRCVVTCGDDYVFGQQCQDECPANATNVVEKIIVYEGSFEKLSICVNVCSEYDPILASFKGKCVNKCPGNAKFQLNNNCISNCPQTHPFLYELDIPERHFSAIQCREVCPTDKELVSRDNKTCVDTCPNHEVVFDSHCMKHCPNASYILFNQKCVLKCPFNMMLQSNTCVYQCARSMNYVYNNTCLTKCPTSMPYFEDNNDGHNVCKQNCSGKLSQGFRCVRKCAKAYYEYNRTCVLTCPASSPFKDTEYDWYSDEGHRVCVKRCPGAEVAANFTCSSTCPGKQLAFNQTCTDHCPESAPYVVNETQSQCFEQCPSGQYAINYTCVQDCPQYAFRNVCISGCPNDTVWMDKKCYTDCPKNTYLVNGTECGHCERHDLKLCVNVCPSERPYTNDGSCVAQCPDGMLSENTICIDEYQCKRGIRYNHQCLDSCPAGTTSISTGEIDGDIRIYKCQKESILLWNDYIGITLCIAILMTLICIGYFRFWPLPYIEKKIQEMRCRKQKRGFGLGEDNPVIRHNDETTSDRDKLIA